MVDESNQSDDQQGESVPSWFNSAQLRLIPVTHDPFADDQGASGQVNQTQAAPYWLHSARVRLVPVAHDPFVDAQDTTSVGESWSPDGTPTPPQPVPPVGQQQQQRASWLEAHPNAPTLSQAAAPTGRQRLANWLMGDKDASWPRRQFVEGLTGSGGIGEPGVGLVDATPLGWLMGAQEAANRGDYQSAVLSVIPELGQFRISKAIPHGGPSFDTIINEARPRIREGVPEARLPTDPIDSDPPWRTSGSWLPRAPNIGRSNDGGATGALPGSNASRILPGTYFDERSRAPTTSLEDAADKWEAPEITRDKIGDYNPHELTNFGLMPENEAFLRNLTGLGQKDLEGHVVFRPAFSNIRGFLLDKDRNRIGLLERTVFPDSAHAAHNVFELLREHQGNSIGKDILANNIEWYGRNGIDFAHTIANMEWGSYAWAKYGFVPKSSSWSDLKLDIADRLDELHAAGVVPDKQYDEIQRIFYDQSGKALWKIVDNTTPIPGRYIDDRKNQFTTLGKALLYKQGWRGKLSLQDKEMMDRFHEYVGKRR
jgi:hypothetical protein